MFAITTTIITIIVITSLPEMPLTVIPTVPLFSSFSLTQTAPARDSNINTSGVHVVFTADNFTVSPLYLKGKIHKAHNLALLH